VLVELKIEKKICLRRVVQRMGVNSRLENRKKNPPAARAEKRSLIETRWEKNWCLPPGM
jgi:hypothetical protein